MPQVFVTLDCGNCGNSVYNILVTEPPKSTKLICLKCDRAYEFPYLALDSMERSEG